LSSWSHTAKVIRVHPIHHDRTRELGAFANAKGRPRCRATARGVAHRPSSGSSDMWWGAGLAAVAEAG